MKDVITNIICVGSIILYVGICSAIFISMCIGAFTDDKQDKQQRN